MALSLNETPDERGFIYGEYFTPTGKSYRINLLPPGEHEGYPKCDNWIVFVDGKSIGEAVTPEVVAEFISAWCDNNEETRGA